MASRILATSSALVGRTVSSLLSLGGVGGGTLLLRLSAALGFSAASVAVLGSMTTLAPLIRSFLALQSARLDRVRALLLSVHERVAQMRSSPRKAMLLLLVGVGIQCLAARVAAATVADGESDVAATESGYDSAASSLLEEDVASEPVRDDHDGGDDASEPDDACFWDVPPESIGRVRRLPLTSSEITDNNLRYMFEVENFTKWHTNFLSFLRMRHPHAAELLALDYDEATEFILEHETARHANVWLAQTLRTVLSTEPSKGKIFEENLMEAEVVQVGISCSGIDVKERLDSAIFERDSKEEDAEWEDFEKTEYFKLGASDDDQRLAVKRIQKKMRVVPSTRRDKEYALLHAIVDKIPSKPPELKAERDKYDRALTLAERTKKPPTLESRELTVELLTEWILLDLEKHATSAQREVSSAEKQKRELERHKNDKGPCTCCGGAHHWSYCTKAPCATCKNRWCQGTREMICWRRVDTLPIYKDANGAVLAKPLQRHMNKLRNEDGKVTTEVSVLEVEVEQCNADGDTDDGLPGMVGQNPFAALQLEVLVLEG